MKAACLISLLGLVLCLSACGGKSKPPNYDGTWSGKTSQGKKITLVVKANRVTSIAYDFAAPGDQIEIKMICKLGSRCARIDETATISSSSTFSAKKNDANEPSLVDYDLGTGTVESTGISNIDYVITGKFSSSTSVSGTADFTFKHRNTESADLTIGPGLTLGTPTSSVNKKIIVRSGSVTWTASKPATQ